MTTWRRRFWYSVFWGEGVLTYSLLATVIWIFLSKMTGLEMSGWGLLGTIGGTSIFGLFRGGYSRTLATRRLAMMEIEEGSEK